MSVFEMDSAGDLDDSALSRKIAKDLENCLFEDNESIANIDSGSIYFDQYIQKQNEQMKHDQEEFDRANKNFTDFLKNNKGGQEIFDEIDRDLKNAKNMIRVKVKKDKQENNDNDKLASEGENNKDNDDSEEEQSFVEIEDAFGEKEKYYPDEITESQYKEIKAKAKREASELAKNMVFAEDKIKREFMEQQGLLLSEENSILSEEMNEEMKDELDASTNIDFLNGIANHSIVANSNSLESNQYHNKLKTNQSSSNILATKEGKQEDNQHEIRQKGSIIGDQIEQNGSIVMGTPKAKKRKFIGGVGQGDGYNRRSMGKSILKSSSGNLRLSQSNYDLIMSGQMPLPSSVNRSIVAKQRIEMKLEQKYEKISAEREMFDMENEDLLSLEQEEYIQRCCFTLKDYRLPELPFQSEQPTPTFNDISYDTFSISKLAIPLFQPLSLNDEGNVLTRDCMQVCLEDLSKPSNRKNLGNILRGNKTASKSKESSFKKIQAQPVVEQSIKVCSIQIKTVQKELKPSQTYDSAADILYEKMRAAHMNLLSSYAKKGAPEQLQKIFSQHQPRLITYFFDSEQENILQDDDELRASSGFGGGFQNDNENKNNTNGQSNKSLAQYLSQDVFSNFDKKRRLELKLENICDIEGLKRLPRLEIVSLSVNRIEKLDQLRDIGSSKIMELNLAQNRITDYSAVNSLKELRFLNLEMNRITKIADLSNCLHLEVLNLNNNAITDISNLQNNRQLRKLYLYRNQIKAIGQNALASNLFLEELDVGRNALVSLDGLQANLLLKKLVAYYNQIQHLPQSFSFVFLVELYLNGNKLQDINNLQYFPCLEYLNISHNAIDKISCVPMLPNLSSLVASFNNISNFESVFNIARASPNLKYIAFSDNEFVKRSVSEDLHDLYDYLFIRNLPRLVEINHQEVDIGRKKYLQVRFSSLLKARTSSHEHAALQSFLGEFALITRQHAFLLLQKKSRAQNLFAQNLDFYKLDSAFTCRHLFSMFKTILGEDSLDERGSTAKSIPRDASSSSNLKKTENVLKRNIRELTNSVFFAKDFFDDKHRKSLWKIASLAFKAIYKTHMRARFYAARRKDAVFIQKHFRGYKVRKIINFSSIFDSRKKHKAAIKIQKVFRGYRLRKKKQALFAGIKYVDDEELPSMDDDWLNQAEKEFDGGLKIPDNFDVMSFINPPPPTATIINPPLPHKNTLLPPIQQPNSKNPSISSGSKLQNNNFISSKPPSPGISQKKGIQKHPIGSSSMPDQNTLLSTMKAQIHSKAEMFSNSDSRSVSSNDNLSSSGLSIRSENNRTKGLGSILPPSQTSQMFYANTKKVPIPLPKQLAPIKPAKVTEEEKQKIMNEWGFTKPEVLQTFAYRLEKQRRSKVKSQPLTAEQRYEKFLHTKPKQ